MQRAQIFGICCHCIMYSYDKGREKKAFVSESAVINDTANQRRPQKMLHVSPSDKKLILHAAIVLPLRGPSPFDPRTHIGAHSCLHRVQCFPLLKPQLLFHKTGVALVDHGVTLPTIHLSKRIDFYIQSILVKTKTRSCVLPLHCPT